MENHSILIQKIFLATRKIHSEFPELAKYMDEIPEHVFSQPDPKVTNKALEDYLESLKIIAKNYAKEHSSSTNKLDNHDE